MMRELFGRRLIWNCILESFRLVNMKKLLFLILVLLSLSYCVAKDASVSALAFAQYFGYFIGNRIHVQGTCTSSVRAS